MKTFSLTFSREPARWIQKRMKLYRWRENNFVTRFLSDVQLGSVVWGGYVFCRQESFDWTRMYTLI